MDYKVIFTGTKGMDITAYFDCEFDCDTFATMMANEGRLTMVKANGTDITDKYVSIVNISEVLKRV